MTRNLEKAVQRKSNVAGYIDPANTEHAEKPGVSDSNRYLVFACREDATSPYVMQHIPALVQGLAGDASLVQLPKSSSVKLGKALAIKKCSAILLVYVCTL